MTKKHFQAVARVIYGSREMIYRNPEHDVVRDALLAEITDGLASVFAGMNEHFDRARFIEACETGRCKGMAR